MSTSKKIDWSDFGTADSTLTLLCAYRCGNAGTISQGMYSIYYVAMYLFESIENRNASYFLHIIVLPSPQF